MSDHGVAQDMQPKEQEPMDKEGVPPPTDESQPNPVVPLVQGVTITTKQGGEPGRHVCSICGKSFNSKAELDMHTESQHQQTQTQEKTQRRKKTARTH